MMSPGPSAQETGNHRGGGKWEGPLFLTPSIPLTCFPPGYSLGPGGAVDNLSDSGHSEISSRSSLVSESSLELLNEERRQRHAACLGDAHLAGSRMERKATLDPDQYSLGSYTSIHEGRHLYSGSTVLSSPSSEELTQDQGDRASLDAADSGRGSWTSCSSGSHDNIQTIQHQRSWETLTFGLPHLDGPAEGAGLWPTDAPAYPEHGARPGQVRGSCWGEDSEGDTGTIKRRGGKDVGSDPETSMILDAPRQLGRPTHLPASSGAPKNLIVRKDSRFRDPPPTPPGYRALTEFAEPPVHPGRKPPDYNVALQRSRMVTRSCDSPQPPSRPPSRLQWSKPADGDPRHPHFPSQGHSAEEEEEDEQVSAV